MKEHSPRQVTIEADGVHVIQNVSHAKPVSIAQNLVRIQQEADPLGFLLKVANGEPIPEYFVREVEGKLVVQVEYTTPTLSQRVQTARYLADKYLPKLSVHAIQTEDKTIDHNSFEAMVKRVAINES